MVIVKQPTLPGVVTANDLTAMLLIEIPRQFPGARVWRRNVGRAVGLDTAKQAISLILARRLKEAVELLQHRPVAFGVAGEGDIDGIAPGGRRLCIEVKVGADKLRPEQENFRDMIRAAGGVWVMARSLDQGMADLREQIQR